MFQIDIVKFPQTTQTKDAQVVKNSFNFNLRMLPNHSLFPKKKKKSLQK